jgi:L-iditol 2-dehydrogenase
VLVSEPLAHRRKTALRFGADEAWAPQDADAGVREVTAGRGVDVVVEMAGTDDALATAVTGARPGGRVAVGGIPSTPRSAFPAAPARRKGLTFAMVRRMHETYDRAIELATDGIDLDALVSDRFDLAAALDAFESAAARNGDKTVVVVSRSGG